jgi:hypothetical protein
LAKSPFRSGLYANEKILEEAFLEPTPFLRFFSQVSFAQGKQLSQLKSVQGLLEKRRSGEQ